MFTPTVYQSEHLHEHHNHLHCHEEMIHFVPKPSTLYVYGYIVIGASKGYYGEVKIVTEEE